MPSDQVRAFVSIVLPGRAVDGLKNLVAELTTEAESPSANWTTHPHLTLLFLGSIGQDEIDPVAKEIRRACSTSGPFEMQIQGIGAFPSASRANVLWAGISDPKLELARLQLAIADTIVGMGSHQETKPFHPHITLARIKADPNQVVPKLIVDWRGRLIADCLCEEVALIQSNLSPSGASYTELGRARLGGGT